MAKIWISDTNPYDYKISEPCLYIGKNIFPHVGIPIIKLKTVSWMSYFYNGNPYTDKTAWWDLIVKLDLLDLYLLENIDGLVQDCSNFIANALELLQSCAKPLIFCMMELYFQTWF